MIIPDSTMEKAFPNENEFVIMAKPDWDRILRYLHRVGLPSNLKDLNVLSLEY